MDNELKFKNGNPGAVQHGNFINYYQFHPPENRINLLPKDIWESKSKEFVALDIGCNAGDLTTSLHTFLTNTIELNASILGIDIDPILIERANEHNKSTKITFECLNIMSDKNDLILNNYLNLFNKNKFDVIFCFSTTMWIHLNNGDEGLRQFLKTLCGLTEMLVLEPQPWKCYKLALKRVKGSDEMFPQFKSLQIRNNVENEIENYIISCGMIKVKESERTQWGRKLLVFNS